VGQKFGRIKHYFRSGLHRIMPLMTFGALLCYKAQIIATAILRCSGDTAKSIFD
jgi:hypothetical protein